MTERQGDVVVATLVLCALVLTGLVVHREFFHSTASVSPLGEVRHVDDWQKYGTQGLTLGQLSAPLRIVVFSDYQCPYCAHLSQALADIRRTKNVAVTYRNYPLEATHPAALAAALAAECANAQGRFAALHELMVTRRDSVGVKPWEAFGKAAKIPDLHKFTHCIDDSTYIRNVRRDIALGDSLGIQATPTFLIRDRVFTGDPGPKQLTTLLAQASQ